jgi:predicted kinase
LARAHHVPAVAIVLLLSVDLCVTRSQARAGRPVPPEAVRSQMRDLENSLPRLGNEGFEIVYTFHTQEEVDDVSIAM